MVAHFRNKSSNEMSTTSTNHSNSLRTIAVNKHAVKFDWKYIRFDSILLHEWLCLAIILCAWAQRSLFFHSVCFRMLFFPHWQIRLLKWLFDFNVLKTWKELYSYCEQAYTSNHFLYNIYSYSDQETKKKWFSLNECKIKPDFGYTFSLYT